MGIVICLGIGFAFGLLSSMFINQATSGLIAEIVLGAIGAVLGGVLFGVMGHPGVATAFGISLYSILADIAGAVGLLFLFHALVGRRNI